MVDLNQDSVAVIIDCWQNDQHLNIYENIANFCYENPAIKAIFVASYINDYDPAHNFLKWPDHEKRYYLPRNQRLIDNAHEFYSKKRNPQVPDHIDQWWSAMNWTRKKFEPFVKHTRIPMGFRFGPFYPEHRPITDDMISNMTIRKDQTILPLWTKSQFIHLISKHFPRTRNIYMMGGAWTRCVRWREVGYLSIQETVNSGLLSPNIRILSKDATVTGYHMDSSSWSRIDHPAWSALSQDSTVQFYDPWQDVLSEKDFKKYITGIKWNQAKKRVLASQCPVGGQFPIGKF